MLDSKQKAAAANALIQWCNSQDLGPADAEAVLSKVLAKLLLRKLPAGVRPPDDPYRLNKIVDTFTLHLVHDVNEQAYNDRHTKR